MKSKLKFCVSCGNPLEDDGRCVSCPAGNRRPKATPREIDAQCAWNDHGYRCENHGAVSDSTTGGGPWYCSHHYWRGIRKFPERATENPPSYRQQWFACAGIEYTPARIGDCPPFRCLGRLAPDSIDEANSAAAAANYHGDY